MFIILHVSSSDHSIISCALTVENILGWKSLAATNSARSLQSRLVEDCAFHLAPSKVHYSFTRALSYDIDIDQHN